MGPKPKKIKWKQTRKKKGKWISVEDEEDYEIRWKELFITKKVRIKYFRKPFKEKNGNKEGKEKGMQESHKKIENERMKEIHPKRENQVRKEGNGNFYNGKGDDSLVENQFKTLTKAYTGFQLIVLRSKRTQKEKNITAEIEKKKLDLFAPEKMEIICYREPAKEKNGCKKGRTYKTQEKNERRKGKNPQKDKQVTKGEEEKFYDDKGDELLVENQIKTLTKAYTGFQLIMLRNKRAQKEEKVKEKVEEEKKLSMNDQSKEEKTERLEEEKKERLYYHDECDKLLVENQFENLAKAVTGFQLVMLSNNEVQSTRTMGISTKNEVQNGQEGIIISSYKSSSVRIIIMSNAYSGIEQVSSELEVNEERNTNTEVREAIESLASIYMHYSIGNRWERIKLFTTLQPEFKEILFSCVLGDHIRNLSKSRSGLISVIQLDNFQEYMREESNTIAVSQENYLREYEGMNCFIEEKLLRATKLSYLKDTYMVPILKFKNRIIYVPLTKFKRKYNYELQTVLVGIYSLKSQLQPLFHNYLIDIEYFQNFLCRFIKKYCYLESKIQYDKLDAEVKAREGTIELVHGSFGNSIMLNRPRTDSTNKEFDQQLMLGLEYRSRIEAKIVKYPPILEAEEQKIKDKES
jgi:hypothetical protein